MAALQNTGKESNLSVCAFAYVFSVKMLLYEGALCTFAYVFSAKILSNVRTLNLCLKRYNAVSSPYTTTFQLSEAWGNTLYRSEQRTLSINYLHIQNSHLFMYVEIVINKTVPEISRV